VVVGDAEVDENRVEQGVEDVENCGHTGVGGGRVGEEAEDISQAELVGRQQA
jgi:hypothetical protein